MIRETKYEIHATYLQLVQTEKLLKEYLIIISICSLNLKCKLN